jgi:hypothetical protein
MLQAVRNNGGSRSPSGTRRRRSSQSIPAVKRGNNS